MTAANDLHAAITAKLDDLEILAKAAAVDAGADRWTPGMFRTGSPDISEHIAIWDPATVLRGLAEDRDVLTRHRPSYAMPPSGRFACAACRTRYIEDCPELQSVARRHGIEVP